MIQSTTLKNFKGFKEVTTFPLSQLNLLTGINGRGKSSFLQSLLLLRQSVEMQDSFEKVFFNGSCVDLGDFNDVKNKVTGNNVKIEISHISEGNKLNLLLEQDESDSMIGRLVSKPTKELIEQYRRMHYIAADRVGPQEFYLKSSLSKFVNVGTKGEWVANVLLHKKSDLIDDDIRDFGHILIRFLKVVDQKSTRAVFSNKILPDLLHYREICGKIFEMETDFLVPHRNLSLLQRLLLIDSTWLRAHTEGPILGYLLVFCHRGD